MNDFQAKIIADAIKEGLGVDEEGNNALTHIRFELEDSGVDFEPLATEITLAIASARDAVVESNNNVAEAIRELTRLLEVRP